MWEAAGLVCCILFTVFVFNPLLALFLVRVLRLPDKGPVNDAGVQFWVAASIPAIISVIAVSLVVSLTDEDASKPWKRRWYWVLIPFFFPAMWSLSLNGSHLTDRTASDVSGRFDISYFQAEFLQATAKPVLAVFFVTFFSMYAATFAASRPNFRPGRRLTVASAVVVYVVMAVAFVLVGRSAGDGYW